MVRYVGGHPLASKPNVTGDETLLYQCLDADGALLYAGITRDPVRRHSRDRNWPGRGCARIAWEWLPTHAEAAERERELIDTLDPPRNGVGFLPPMEEAPGPSGQRRPDLRSWSSVIGRPWDRWCSGDVESLDRWCPRCGWPHEVHG